MNRILIADDHDALRSGLARGLSMAGHQVEEAANGNVAIERLHDGNFSVVLSDLKMIGSDGVYLTGTMSFVDEHGNAAEIEIATTMVIETSKARLTGTIG